MVSAEWKLVVKVVLVLWGRGVGGLTEKVMEIWKPKSDKTCQIIIYQ